jgi:hypothetical protein
LKGRLAERTKEAEGERERAEAAEASKTELEQNLQV